MKEKIIIPRVPGELDEIEEFTRWWMLYSNFSGALMESVQMSQCDLTEAIFSDVKYKKWKAEKCLFVGCNFFKTKLRGFDFSKNEMVDLIVSETMEELKGCRISPVQALEIVKLLEIEVR